MAIRGVGTSRSYAGGDHGSDVLRSVLADSPPSSGPAAALLLLGLGGEQADMLGPDVERLGREDVEVLLDEEDDVRGSDGTLTGPRSTP